MNPHRPILSADALAAAEAAHTAASRAYYADNSHVNALALSAAYRAWNEAMHLENPTYADARRSSYPTTL